MEGRWFTLSLPEQLGNVGSEIYRVIMTKEKDAERSRSASDRALELMDYTLQDRRWSGLRLQELTRVREIICDAIEGGSSYATTWEDLDNYFFAFALMARSKT